MSEETIVEYCSPTLAGLKTGSLFSCSFENREAMNSDIRRFNAVLVPKGLCLLPLKFVNGRGLLYLYRPSFLERDLSEEDASRLLAEAGYSGASASEQLQHLIGRLGRRDSFPHEIGLFLSYPPEDVRGFIEQRAQNCKCAGCWKVYGDEQAARKTFRKYRRCRENYLRALEAGMPLSQLAVRAGKGS